MREIIDNNLVEELRLIYAQTDYVIDGVDIIIVSDEKTHNFLLRNFTISESILKYYHYQTSKYLSDNEFKKMQNIGFFGEKDYFLAPYPLRIYGAYFHRVDLITKLSSLTFEKQGCIVTLNNKKVEYFDDLYPYFENYSQGFKDGYDNFEDACITKYLTMFPDKTDFVNKVFEFLTKTIILEHDWNNNHSGFSFSITGKKNKKMEISGGFENGQKQGRFYKAWSIVFSNNSIFESLFSDFCNLKKPPELIDTSKPEEKYKTQNLFKVGLLFAKGEMNKYFAVNNNNESVMNQGLSAPQIVTEIKNNLGININREYILASINNYASNKENGNKNIFNSLGMMTKILSHCETEKITVDAYFKSRLPKE